MVLAKDVMPDFSEGELTFGSVKTFQYGKTLKDELSGSLTKERALWMYRTMLYNRIFEEMIIELQCGQFVPFEGYTFSGATHLSIGHEAVAAGANAAGQGGISAQLDNILATSTERIALVLALW